MLVTCLKCSIVFEKTKSSCERSPRHFCSRSCSVSVNNLGKCRNKRIAKPKPIKKKRISREEFEKRTLGEYRLMPSVIGKHPSWLHSHVRNFARTWNKILRDMPCQKCGYDFHVEMAHIKPISSFTADITLGEINSPNNILVLCRNHHWEFDNNILSLANIPKR